MTAAQNRSARRAAGHPALEPAHRGARSTRMLTPTRDPAPRPAEWREKIARAHKLRKAAMWHRGADAKQRLAERARSTPRTPRARKIANAERAIVERA